MRTPVAVLHGELGGDVAAEREPDQIDLVEPEEVEQLDIVHDVVVDVVHRRIVGGFAEARMKRKKDPELVGPGLGELEAVERAGPMQKQQRLPAAGGQQDDLHPVDGVRLAFEFGHG